MPKSALLTKGKSKMSINELSAALEAVIFAGGEPIDIDRLCQIFNSDIITIEEALKLLSDRLDDPISGIRLVRLEKSYQICTKNKYGDYIRAAYDLRRKNPLSQAALEVLAVVAYNQPVTKAYVEQVRGVDCSGVVSSLVEKGLLEEKGRLELPGRPLLYGTTDNFLRSFSISSLDELPEVPELEAENKQLEMESIK